jgi:hypothetical protein
MLKLKYTKKVERPHDYTGYFCRPPRWLEKGRSFDNLTDYSAFIQDAIAHVVGDGHEEMLTGIINTGYYGFVFVKPGSHISIKPIAQYRQDEVTLSVKIELLFPGGKIA